MTTDAVCERVRHIDGIDQSMMVQYTATIRKVSDMMWRLNLPRRLILMLTVFFWFQANVNGRVLSQCNIDELKKEMNMNFGDWQLFRATVSPLSMCRNVQTRFYTSSRFNPPPRRRFWTCVT